MMLGGEPWGELEVMTAPGRPRVPDDDETFLRAIADQLVGAIHRAELFAQIEALAYTDSLTGLASRRAVETALEEACDAPSGPGSPALVLCDIDDLKQVNDSGGHEAGDRALRRAAEALVGGRGAARGRGGRALRRRRVLRAPAVRHRRRTPETWRWTPCAASTPWAASASRAAWPRGRMRRAGPPNCCARRTRRSTSPSGRGQGVDVVVAGEAAEEAPPTPGCDRAYRASDPDAQLARELLELLDDMNGASAEERLARLRARLEREA